jgi:heavy metal translocating P-type ATPase
MAGDRTLKLNLALLVIAAGGLAAGLAARGTAGSAWAEWAMLAGTLPVLVAALLDMVLRLWRREVGLDLIALLSIGGAVALGETLAAVVIGMMLASGRVLEGYAEGRARREMTALLARVPRTASRYRDGALEEVALAEIAPGDRLLIRAGEAVPVDGIVATVAAVLDESALTGESHPATRRQGEALRSGAVNAGAGFDMTATASAEASTLAGIVRLVRAAQEARAPSTRLADRAAAAFVPFCLAVAGAAWLVSGDAVRGLAVLVVATPCPLILGVPVAIISGLSRCAGRGVLVKGGGALEKLARARTLFLDKTGTLTTGQARVTAVETLGGLDASEALRLAASLDQASQHVVAQAIVAAARSAGLKLAMPERVEETPGAGVVGLIEGRRVAVGGHAFICAGAAPTAWEHGFLGRMAAEGATGTFLAVDGRIVGALLLADDIRPDTPRALRLLRRAGIRRIVMLSGDRADVAEAIGAALDVDEVRAELLPQDKLAAIGQARAAGENCVMVGDGVNDAPALAAADVGVAMGARGAGAASEAGDVVLLVDRLDRLAEALAVARGTRRIAIETVSIGIGLSILAMPFAAAGLLPPVAGAVLQEVIDVAAILNALRVLTVRIPGRPLRPLPAADVARLTEEHARMTDLLARLRAVADLLTVPPPPAIASALAEIAALLRERLLPHERVDERDLYPDLALRLGGDDPLASMHRAHGEIQRLGGRLLSIIAALPEGGPDDPATMELRRVLYGLEAILRLHIAEENEVFHTLAGAEARDGEPARA